MTFARGRFHRCVCVGDLLRDEARGVWHGHPSPHQRAGVSQRTLGLGVGGLVSAPVGLAAATTRRGASWRGPVPCRTGALHPVAEDTRSAVEGCAVPFPTHHAAPARSTQNAAPTKRRAAKRQRPPSRAATRPSSSGSTREFVSFAASVPLGRPVAALVWHGRARFASGAAGRGGRGVVPKGRLRHGLWGHRVCWAGGEAAPAAALFARIPGGVG